MHAWAASTLSKHVVSNADIFLLEAAMVQGFHTLKAKVISLLMLIYKHRSVTQDRVRLLLGYSEHKWLW